MLWVSLTLLAVFLWASSNLIDKHILEKYIRQPLICLIVLGWVGLIFSIIVLTKNFVWLSIPNLILSLAAGFIDLAISICYFKALKIEEASRILPLFSLDAIFTLILAALFLGEILTPIKYLGVLLLVGGAILISMKRDFRLRNKRAFWLMIFAALFAALSNVLTKYLLNFADYWTIFAYIRIGSFIGMLPIMYIYFPELKRTIKIYGKRVLGLITASETINMFGLIAFTAALSFGYVSLVGGISQLHPLFVLFLASLLSLFYPNILKEELKGSIIALKIVGIILIIIGGFLIV